MFLVRWVRDHGPSGGAGLVDKRRRQANKWPELLPEEMVFNGFPLAFNWFLMVFNGFPFGFPLVFDGVPFGFPWMSFGLQWVSLDSPKVFNGVPLVSNGFPLVSPRCPFVSCGFQRIPFGFTRCFLVLHFVWLSIVFPGISMDVLWFYMDLVLT